MNYELDFEYNYLIPHSEVTQHSKDNLLGSAAAEASVNNLRITSEEENFSSNSQ